MNFGFKLFKVVTGINLFITGFFLLLMCMMILTGNIAAGLVSLIIFGGIAIHAVLAGYLQRSLQDPGFTLKESTPIGIYIMSAFSALIGCMSLYNVVMISLHREAYLNEMTRQFTTEQERAFTGILDKVIIGAQIFILFYSTIIITNAIQSVVFLNKWKKKKDDQTGTNIDLDLDA